MRIRQAMKQIVTGPLGRVMYHDASGTAACQYPALNMPCRAFARGEALVGANARNAPHVTYLPHVSRQHAARALIAAPGLREHHSAERI